MTEGSGNTTFSVPMAPAGYGGGDMLGGGMNGIWGVIILLAVLGYGNGGFFGGNRGGGYGGEIQRGFDQSALTSMLSAIQSSQDSNQMALMQQFFNMLTQFQNCCCENRLASAQLGTQIAQEGAATRAASANDRQMIMDKLCQLEIDGIKQNYEGQIRALQNQLDAERGANQSLRFAASQGAQTAQIMADNAAQTVALERYLAPQAQPAYIVPNPNCCGNNFGYNCNCGAA